MMEWLQSVDWNVTVLLLISGVVVGIINTLGGGGSGSTMALYMAMGIPVATANGTNRIAVVMQNFSATIAFMLAVEADVPLSLWNFLLVRSAIIEASVVLPIPDGP